MGPLSSQGPGGAAAFLDTRPSFLLSFSCAAVNRLLDIKGGIVAVEGGRVVYELPLPLGGMMSERPMEALAEEERRSRRFCLEGATPYHDPLYTFIFLPNDFLPDVRMNRKGVVDIKKDEILWPSRRLPPLR